MDWSRSPPASPAWCCFLAGRTAQADWGGRAGHGRPSRHAVRRHRSAVVDGSTADLLDTPFHAHARALERRGAWKGEAPALARAAVRPVGQSPRRLDRRTGHPGTLGRRRNGHAAGLVEVGRTRRRRQHRGFGDEPLRVGAVGLSLANGGPGPRGHHGVAVALRAARRAHSMVSRGHRRWPSDGIEEARSVPSASSPPVVLGSSRSRSRDWTDSSFCRRWSCSDLCGPASAQPAFPCLGDLLRANSWSWRSSPSRVSRLSPTRR